MSVCTTARAGWFCVFMCLIHFMYFLLCLFVFVVVLTKSGFFKISVAMAVFNILLPVEQFLARTAEQFEAWLLNSIDTVQ